MVPTTPSRRHCQKPSAASRLQHRHRHPLQAKLRAQSETSPFPFSSASHAPQSTLCSSLLIARRSATKIPIPRPQDTLVHPPPPAERIAVPSAGQLPPLGPSEVERGFRQNVNSRNYNIVSTGPRLNGKLNTEEALSLRNERAHAAPAGRAQHPEVNPLDRGPLGTRQSYDIITGCERPRERWS